MSDQGIAPHHRELAARLERSERDLRQLLARAAVVAARSQARLDAIKDSQQ